MVKYEGSLPPMKFYCDKCGTELEVGSIVDARVFIHSIAYDVQLCPACAATSTVTSVKDIARKRDKERSMVDA